MVMCGWNAQQDEFQTMPRRILAGLEFGGQQVLARKCKGRIGEDRFEWFCRDVEHSTAQRVHLCLNDRFIEVCLAISCTELRSIKEGPDMTRRIPSSRGY